MLSVLLTIWVLLMLYSSVIEYRYYQAVRIYEPNIWQQLGSPSYLKIPFAFISPKGSILLKEISNETVLELAKKHRISGGLFLAYVIVVLVTSIVYFKIA